MCEISPAQIMKRPILNKEISLDDFEQFYWLKEELQLFCKRNGIHAYGPKIDIAKRIENFLKTGRKVKMSDKKSSNSISDKRDYSNITINTKIGENYKSSEPLRDYFESIIGKQFKFTVVFQQFCKNNPDKTYKDAIDFWYKNKDFKTTKIAPQFEYNTYIRDFMAVNKGKKISDAILCWKYKKSLRGNNKYCDSDLIALNK